jgi:NDP-sugar pyrophosphorylase family protein
MPDIMTGAIIAAGRGERLRNASAGLPKPLVELDGRPMLIRQIELMQRHGLQRVNIIINSETAGLIDKKQIVLPAGVDCCVKDTPSSMESLLALGARLQAASFLLATVDAVVTDGEFERFLNASRNRVTSKKSQGSLDGVLGMVEWRGDARPLFVNLASDGLITGFGGERGAVVTAGLYCFTPRIFEHAEEARSLKLNSLRQFLGLLIARQFRFAAVELTGVVDVDEAADLAAAQKLVGSAQ